MSSHCASMSLLTKSRCFLLFSLFFPHFIFIILLNCMNVSKRSMFISISHFVVSLLNDFHKPAKKKKTFLSEIRTSVKRIVWALYQILMSHVTVAASNSPFFFSLLYFSLLLCMQK